MESDLLEKAKTLVRVIEYELKHGTKHWDARGCPLLTASEILAALIDDGQIQFQPIESRKHIFKGYVS